MFPRCANSECPASFGSLREGTFFRFHRAGSHAQVSAKHHSVEHAWLCTQCSERYTVEYREDKTFLVPIAPAMPLIPVIEEVPANPAPLRKRTRPARRRPSSRRASAAPPASNPFVVLAITPRGDFDRN
jgi:hypothetical protein